MTFRVDPDQRIDGANDAAVTLIDVRRRLQRCWAAAPGEAGRAPRSVARPRGPALRASLPPE